MSLFTCSELLQRNMPPKMKDPGRFTIPCIIGQVYFDHALCDLRASINIMTSTIFDKLGIGNVKPTDTVLQMADESVKHPRGFIEDIIFKVSKSTFPIDF